MFYINLAMRRDRCQFRRGTPNLMNRACDVQFVADSSPGIRSATRKARRHCRRASLNPKVGNVGLGGSGCRFVRSAHDSSDPPGRVVGVKHTSTRGRRKCAHGRSHALLGLGCSRMPGDRLPRGAHPPTCRGPQRFVALLLPHGNSMTLFTRPRHSILFTLDYGAATPTTDVASEPDSG